MCKKIAIVIACFFLMGCSPNTNETVLYVDCASSMKSPMESIKIEFEKQNPDIDIQFNFGGSKTLKNKIIHANTPHIFISASVSDMAELEDSMLMTDVVDIASNQLVLASIGFDTIEKLGVSNPATSPLGEYTLQYLEQQEYFSTIEPLLVVANDSHSLLQWVLDGYVDAGFLYKSDISQHSELQTIINVPDGEISDIKYQIGKGILEEYSDMEEVERFHDFMQGEYVRLVLGDSGFITSLYPEG